MERSSDAELMGRVREGDHDAFGQLVDRHKDSLVNYLTRLTRCRDRAEDLAQEAFVRLYRAAPRYTDKGHFQAYLFRIATNCLRSEERRARRWRGLVPLVASNGDRPEPGPQARLLSDEATEKVGEALSGLPLRYRAPLVLREIEGWSYREIAGALDCREGTVKSRINRGRKQLRDLLEPYWNGAQR